MTEFTQKRKDLFVALLFPVLASIVSISFKLNYMSTIVVFCVPFGIWLSLKVKVNIIKAFIFSLLVSVPLITIIEHIAVINNQWFVPKSLFPFRLLGTVPLEDLLGGFLHVYSVIIFYEYFLDKHPREIIRSKMKYLLFPLLFFTVLFLFLIKLIPSIFYFHYAYFWIGIFFLLAPVLIFFFLYPKIFLKISKAVIYFFIFLLIFEITGIALGLWVFPSLKFIGWINIGTFKIPVEEFAFFLVVSTFTILSFYEYFDDDLK